MSKSMTTQFAVKSEAEGIQIYSVACTTDVVEKMSDVVMRAAKEYSKEGETVADAVSALCMPEAEAIRSKHKILSLNQNYVSTYLNGDNVFKELGQSKEDVVE